MTFADQHPGTATDDLPLAWTTVDGVRIRTADSGGSGDATILLTSPWPESVYAFAPIWGALAPRFRLFAVDLPGFGASDQRPELLSPMAMGAFLARVIEECGLGTPHVVAPDVGTAAALFAAASSPDVIASVVVGSGGVAVPITLGDPLRGWVLDPDLEPYRTVDPAGVIDAALGTIPGHPFPEAIRQDYLASYGGERFVTSMAYARRYPEELPVLADRLREIETPVLIIAGLRDRVVPLANAKFLAVRLRRSRMVTVATGHFVWEEAPEEYGTLIADWVGHGYRQLQGQNNRRRST